MDWALKALDFNSTNVEAKLELALAFAHLGMAEYDPQGEIRGRKRFIFNF